MLLDCSRKRDWVRSFLILFSPFSLNLNLQKTQQVSFLSSGSARSRCILVPFKRYGCQKKSAQKVLVTPFPCIFHLEAKRNIVYKQLKAKNISRDSNILPQMHLTSNIFGHSATIIWGLLNCPILNIKKMVCTKNVWMRHCLENKKFLLKPYVFDIFQSENQKTFPVISNFFHSLV